MDLLSSLASFLGSSAGSPAPSLWGGGSLGCPVNSGYSVDNLQGEGLGAKLTLLSLLENREEAGASEPLARNLSMLSSSLTLQHSGHPRTRGEAGG